MKTSSLQHQLSYPIRFPKTFIGLVLLLVALLTTGFAHLEISNDFRVYLSKDNPELQAFEKFEDNYVKSNTATLVVTALTDDLFNREGLTLIDQLTQAAWDVDYTYRVSSLTNYLYTRAQNDDIETNFLVEKPEGLALSEIDAIREIALNENRLINHLLTTDGRLSVIVMNLNLPTDIANPSIIVTEQVEIIRDRFRLLYPSFQIDNGGSVAFNTTLARAVANDLTTLLPLSYLIIFIGLYLFLRCVYATLSIFILITTCLLSTFGFFGWVSPTLTPIAGFAPSILISIMVADSVHIIVTFQQLLAKGVEKKDALMQGLLTNFSPILITSLTTMIGFLSLNYSESPPYRDLGNMVAFGVLIALFFSLFFLPCLMLLLPIRESAKTTNSNWLKKFAELVIKRKRFLLISISALSIGLMLFIPNNKISDNWANYFNDNFEIMRLVKRIDGYLSGINALEYSLESTRDKGIFDSDYLRQMDEFEVWFKTQSKIVEINSFSQLMKDLNQVMHQDQSQWYTIPDTPELAAQYLLFYEMGLPQGFGLDNLVTIHQDATRFSVSVSDAGSDELLAIDRRAQQWLQQNAPAIRASNATGLGVVFAHIAERNITSLLKGTLIALVGISLILMLIFKSVKYGLISLVPNLIPAAMAYGFWGMTYGYVDISLSIVACSTLGIVVDDTVHFFHKYLAAKRQGIETAECIRLSFTRVGSAIITTSVVLAGGFSILAFSNMNTSATIGILMAITLIFALLVDLLLLPPLLLYLDNKTTNH